MHIKCALYTFFGFKYHIGFTELNTKILFYCQKLRQNEFKPKAHHFVLYSVATNFAFYLSWGFLVFVSPYNEI